MRGFCIFRVWDAQTCRRAGVFGVAGIFSFPELFRGWWLFVWYEEVLVLRVSGRCVET